MKKIAFFAYSIAPRSHKRINSFLNAGYDVSVYTFSKPNPLTLKDIRYPVNTYGSAKHLSYFKRFLKVAPWINEQLKTIDRNTTVVYFFSLNTAWASLGRKRLKYAYEESDMLFANYKSSIMQWIIKKINKRVIKNSALTVFTSEGFTEYYYKGITPENVIYVPNKLTRNILELPKCAESGLIDVRKLRFAFVGWVRYETIYLFAKFLKKNYPQHEFNFYGDAKLMEKEKIEELRELGCKFNGAFSNPTDLPSIYNNIDVVVSTYDVRGVNPQYAEPNKIYEAIYFRKPIVVSDNSFLANKVRKLGIGVAVDALYEESVIKGIEELMNSYPSFIESLNRIPQADAVDDNGELFDRINML